jgi:hypothetical protein
MILEKKNAIESDYTFDEDDETPRIIEVNMISGNCVINFNGKSSSKKTLDINRLKSNGFKELK